MWNCECWSWTISFTDRRRPHKLSWLMSRYHIHLIKEDNIHHPQQHLTIYDHIWPYLTTSDHIWPHLTISDHIWPHLTISDQYQTISDHIWSISDHIWPCLTNTRPYLTNIRPYLTISDHIWPYLTISINYALLSFFERELHVLSKKEKIVAKIVTLEHTWYLLWNGSIHHPVFIYSIFIGNLILV